MSWFWTIYSTRSQKEAIEVESDLERALEDWIEERGEQAAEERMETCGEIGPGGRIPSAADVLATSERFGLDVDPMVIERLGACRSSVVLDRIRGSGLEHPLQVSIVAFLLRRLGECLIDWGDHRIALGERALADLQRLRGAGALGAQRDRPKKVRQRKERPGEVRSIRLVEAMHRCASDADLAIDFRRMCTSLPPIQAKLLEHLAKNGAADDASIARALDMDTKAARRELDDLDQKLAELFG